MKLALRSQQCGGLTFHYNDPQKSVSNSDAARRITVSVNGERRSVPENLTVRGLLEHLGLDTQRLAVELDRAIVRRTEWDVREVLDGAQVEIVEFVGGG
jgi:thiamine biosynthesis protein ThiS